MVTNSSILAWKIPWTEEPDRLYSPWGCKESDLTKLPYTHTHTHTHTGDSAGREVTSQCRGLGFDPWSGKIPHAAEELRPCSRTTEPVL